MTKTRTRFLCCLEFICPLLFPSLASYLAFYLFCKSEGRLLAFFHAIGIAICQAGHDAFLEDVKQSANARDIFIGDTVDVPVDGSCVDEWGSGSKEFE